jgi:adenylate kinase
MVQDGPVVLCILEKILDSLNRGMKIFIIDGYPRSVTQLLFFREMGLNVRGAVFIKNSMETCLKQVAKRRAEMIARGENPRLEDEPETARRRQEKQRELISHYCLVALNAGTIVPDLDGRPKVIAVINAFGFDEAVTASLQKELKGLEFD